MDIEKLKLLVYIACTFFLLVLPSGNSSETGCPANAVERKIKYGQFDNLELWENCVETNSVIGQSWLGSGSRFTCGMNETGKIDIFDPEEEKTNVLLLLCMNVKGAEKVTISMTGYKTDTVVYEEVIQNSDGWNRFCMNYEAITLYKVQNCDFWDWFITVYPANEYSSIMVKNMKMAVCSFQFDSEQLDII